MEVEIYKKVTKKYLPSLQEFERSTQNRKLTENYNGRKNTMKENYIKETYVIDARRHNIAS